MGKKKTVLVSVAVVHVIIGVIALGLGLGRQLEQGLGSYLEQGLDLGQDLVEQGLDLGQDLVEQGLDLGQGLVEQGLDLGQDLVEQGQDLVEQGLDLGQGLVEQGLDLGQGLVEQGLDLGQGLVEQGLGLGYGLVQNLAQGLGLGLQDDFKSTFLARCEKKSSGYNCEEIWKVFQQAYVNKDPCKVPVEAYDPLIAAVPVESKCNWMLFWSQTKDVVRDFTEKKKNCYLTLEDTLLGSVLDGLTWCGKEGSSDTFTTGCPGRNDCENPVRSFWRRASAAFADVACGDITVMLNGSVLTPFIPTRTFASVEVKRFKAPRVTYLNVVLVTGEHSMTDCNNPSMNNLRHELDTGIVYHCKEIHRTEIEACASKIAPCGYCLH